MASDLIKFDYEGAAIRSFSDENGEMWFCAKDIGEVIGLASAREAVSGLDDDEKRSVRISNGTPGNPNYTFVGKYALDIGEDTEHLEYDRPAKYHGEVRHG